MSTRKPWIIAPDAARVVTIMATPDQVEQAAGDPVVAPPDTTPEACRLVTVELAGLTRTGWATAPANTLGHGHPALFTVHLIPLLTVESFRDAFTTCGFGWAVSEGPVAADEQVEVSDGKETFTATAASTSQPYGRWWRTLLHVTHPEDNPIPATMTVTVPSDADRVDVPIDEICGWRTVEVGQPVELLGTRTVRAGTAVELRVHDGLPVYSVLLTDTGMARTDPTTGWTRPDPPRPRLVPDRIEAVLLFAEAELGGWPTDGSITTHMGDRHFPEEPFGEPAIRVAEITWRLTGGSALSCAQQQTVLQVAMMREAEDRKLRVDWQAVRTWVDQVDGSAVAHGEFPLLRPVSARTPEAGS